MANMKSIKKRVDALAREKREREMAQRDRDKLCELVNDIKRDAVKYVLDHCVSANPDTDHAPYRDGLFMEGENVQLVHESIANNYERLPANSKSGVNKYVDKIIEILSRED